MAGLEHSEMQAFYIETGEILEKLIKIMDFGLLLTPIMAVWPGSVFCLFVYSVTDVGDSALELLMPMW